MALDDEDVREILRLIDESDVAELRVEVEGLSLHVVRGSAAAEMRAAPAAPAAPAGEPAGLEREAADGLAAVTAPMIGTFYRAEAPGATPFVEVGSRVEETTVVCLIEVMKMMNSIPAGVSGTIAEVCVENAEPVEYGTPLFLVRADA